MTDTDFLSPVVNQIILTSHIEAVSRASRETGIVNGNRLTASTPADMVVTIGAGRIKIAGTPSDVVEDTVTHDAAHATLPRIDIIYRDVAGAAQIAKGTAATIEDPKGLSDWKSYTSPLPPSSIPPGAIIGAVWIPAECTAITSEYIWMFAGGVGDLATSIGTPGTDAMPASEKAVRDVLAECAPAAKGVTNGDSHDHSGGDGAQIDHGSLGGRTDDDHSIYYNQARGDTRYAQLAHAARHASGGADAIKIDDLAAGDDNTDLNASTTKHGLMQKYPGTNSLLKGNGNWLVFPGTNSLLQGNGDWLVFPGTAQALKGDGSWIKRYFEIDFPFGNGQDVIENFQCHEVAVPINCKITRVDFWHIQSWEIPGIAGAATAELYIHDLGAARGEVVDLFVIADGQSYYTESGLNIAVAQHKVIQIVVGYTSTAKQVVVRLFCEAT